MFLFFFFNDPATTEIYTLSLHDALPILKTWHERFAEKRENGGKSADIKDPGLSAQIADDAVFHSRSEEHTSELQSRPHLVCRLLLEKKKKKNTKLHMEYR